MGRAPCCDKANVKRGPWSPEEDAALRSYIHNHGSVTNWIALPNKAGLKRCGKSCRLRWLNYLRPDIKHGFFTKEEDDIISTLFLKIGSRWSAIASKLPGRTDNDVKNYWNTRLKKRVMEAQASPYDSHHQSSGPPLLGSRAFDPSFHSLSSISSAPIQKANQADYQGSSCTSNESLNLKPLRENPSSLEFNYGSIADLLSSSNFEEAIDRLWA